MNTTKTTIKNHIIDYLQLTTYEYDCKVMEYFFDWCLTHGKSSEHIQQLMANSKIDKWFMYEFRKLEMDFCNAVPFLIQTKKNLQYEHQAYMGRIFSIYPKPLIEKIPNVISKEFNQYPNYNAN